MQKLRGGADLMTPGLADEPPFPESAVKGAVVAVAGLDRHTVPLFVGVCEIDIAGLGEVQGTKGHAVRGVHWEGDELWAWSSSSRPGQPAPEYLAGWDLEAGEEDVAEIEERATELSLDQGQQTQSAEEVPPVDSAEQHEVGAPVEEVKEPSTKGRRSLFLFRYLVRKLTNLQRSTRLLRKPSSILCTN